MKRERRAAIASGLQIEIVTGCDIKSKHWDAFFACYIATSHNKWGTPYLNRDFFARLGETMAERVALIMAADDGRYVAGALNLIGADTRSEEHTSELQSRRKLVCRRLLEKKNNIAHRHNHD